MEIMRVIDGKDYIFELTDQELSAAFYEQRNKFDHDDIKVNLDYPSNFDYLCDNDEEFEYMESIFDDPDVIDEAAKLYRKWLDDNSAWFDDAQEAFENVLSKRIREHFKGGKK